MAKGFGVTIDYVLEDLTYENLLMYNRTIPEPKRYEERKEGDDGVRIKADDPAQQEILQKYFEMNINE